METILLGYLNHTYPTEHPRCCRPPAGNIVGALYHKLETQANAPEDGRNHRSKHVELIGINNKPLLLHLVGCLYYLYQRIHGQTNIKITIVVK